MGVVLQRVSEASVSVGGKHGRIYTCRVCLLAGIAKSDTRSDVDHLSDKVLGLRIFPDSSGKMNRNIVDAGELLIVSQFTLYGDCQRGQAAQFRQGRAAGTGPASLQLLLGTLRSGPVPVETGVFQASMEVTLSTTARSPS